MYNSVFADTNLKKWSDVPNGLDEDEGRKPEQAYYNTTKGDCSWV